MRKAPWILMIVASGCSRREVAQVPPTPAPPQIVYVVVTPTAVPEVAFFTLVPTQMPTAATQSADYVVKMPTPAPTIDVSAIPNQDREREKPATTLREQMVRCLTYTVAVRDYGPIGTRNGVQAHVHAKNSCSDVSFSGEDCWFEIRSKDKNGSTLSRDVGRFQSSIPAYGEADTVIAIVTGFGETIEASPWWAAGGGKKAGQ